MCILTFISVLKSKQKISQEQPELQILNKKMKKNLKTSFENKSNKIKIYIENPTTKSQIKKTKNSQNKQNNQREKKKIMF